jgi:hypothetical protein
VRVFTQTAVDNPGTDCALSSPFFTEALPRAHYASASPGHPHPSIRTHTPFSLLPTYPHRLLTCCTPSITSTLFLCKESSNNSPDPTQASEEHR